MHWASLLHSCMFLISLGLSSSWRGKTKKNSVREQKIRLGTEFFFVLAPPSFSQPTLSTPCCTHLQPGAGYWRSRSLRLSSSNSPPVKIREKILRLNNMFSSRQLSFFGVFLIRSFYLIHSNSKSVQLKHLNRPQDEWKCLNLPGCSYLSWWLFGFMSVC